MNKICIAIVIMTVPFLVLVLRLHDKEKHPQVFRIDEETTIDLNLKTVN